MPKICVSLKLDDIEYYYSVVDNRYVVINRTIEDTDNDGIKSDGDTLAEAFFNLFLANKKRYVDSFTEITDPNEV